MANSRVILHGGSSHSEVEDVALGIREIIDLSTILQCLHLSYSSEWYRYIAWHAQFDSLHLPRLRTLLVEFETFYAGEEGKLRSWLKTFLVSHSGVTNLTLSRAKSATWGEFQGLELLHKLERFEGVLAPSRMLASPKDLKMIVYDSNVVKATTLTANFIRELSALPTPMSSVANLRMRYREIHFDEPTLLALARNLPNLTKLDGLLMSSPEQFAVSLLAHQTSPTNLCPGLHDWQRRAPNKVLA